MNKLIGLLWLFILIGVGIIVVYLEINQGMDLVKLSYVKMVLLMMAVWVILFTKKIEEKKVNTSSKKKKEGKF